MHRRNNELSRAIRNALGIQPAVIGGAAVAIALTTGTMMPADAAIIIGPGGAAGAVTNNTLLDYISIDTSTISGDITNNAPGKITGALSPSSTPAVSIMGSALGQSFINNGAIGSPLLDNMAVVMMNTTLANGSITNNGVIRSDSIGVYLNNAWAQGGVHNNGLIQTADTALLYENPTIVGGITNTGTIKSLDEQGIFVDADVFFGGINNSGLIDTFATAIAIEDVTTFNGGIWNSGTIISRDDEIIDTGSTLTFSGGIHNSGLMRAMGETAIDLDGLEWFDSGIHNSGTIVSTTDTAIYASISTFVGGIHNSGLIDGADTGIDLTGVTFSGGIHNSGTIRGRDDYGIYSNYDTFSGGINNSGRIESASTALYLNGDWFDSGIVNSGTIISRTYYGIDIDYDTFVGGINNSGLIQSYYTAIQVDATSFGGGILNSGTIMSRTEYGIDLDVSTFTGGINNSGLIDSYSTALNLNVDTFFGGITNSGTIYNRSEYSIDLSFDTFMGGINNSGLLDSEYSAITASGTHFDGGITNSGTIRSRYDGAIDLSISTFIGGINNSGLIESQETGLDVNVSTFFGGINNSGTIRTYDDYGIYLNNETFDGGINNSGLIDSNYTAIYVRSDTFFGGIWNSGTLMSASYYGIELTGDTFVGGINNSGLIDSMSTGIYISSSVTFQGDLVNTGTIRSFEEDGIEIRTDNFTGVINNAGLIDAGDIGIEIDGSVAGGIYNTGTIMSFDHAIDLGGASGAHTIHQMGGAIYGDLDLSNAFVDTVNLSGGMIQGSVYGDGTDVINVFGGNSWFDGIIRDIDQINVTSGMLTFDEWIVDTNTLSITGGSFRLRPSAVVEVSDYSQPGGTLSYELQPGGVSGQIIATSTAALGGTLEVTPREGSFFTNPSETYYSIIASPGLTGTFAAVTSTSIFLSPTAVYGTTNIAGDPDVDLVVERLAFNDAVGIGGFRGSNQSAVAGGIEAGLAEAGGSNPAADELYTMLYQMGTAAEYTSFLDAVSGSSHAGVGQAALIGSQTFTGRVGGRLSSRGGLGGVSIVELGADKNRGGAAGDPPFHMAAPGTWSVWMSGDGGWGDVDGDENSVGFEEDGYGVTVGIDYQLNEQWLLGVAGGYGKTDLDFDNRSDTEGESWQIAGYAQWESGTWFANGVFSYGENDFDSNRRIAFGTVDTVAKSDTEGDGYSIYGEGGYIYKMQSIELRPFFGIGWSDGNIDGYTETDAGLYNLMVDDMEMNSLTTNLGARASTDWMVWGDRRLTGEVRAAWQHELEDQTQDITATLEAVRSIQFRVESQEISEDTGIFGVGFNLEVNKQTDVYMNFNARVNGDYDSQTVGGGVRVSW